MTQNSIMTLHAHQKIKLEKLLSVNQSEPRKGFSFLFLLAIVISTLLKLSLFTELACILCSKMIFLLSLEISKKKLSTAPRDDRMEITNTIFLTLVGTDCCFFFTARSFVFWNFISSLLVLKLSYLTPKKASYFSGSDFCS